MTLPRFTTGRYGKITAQNINDTFAAVEKVQAMAQPSRSMVQPKAMTVLGRIVGCTTDAVQGVGQATTVGSGATARRAWLYDWEEVQLGVADFESTPGVGSCVSHTGPANVNGGLQGEISGSTDYVPALDFTPEARLITGDLVLLQRVLVRSASKYDSMWAVVSLLEPTTFLARLTSKSDVDGVYLFSAVTATQPLASSTVRPAVNLYEINAIRSRSSTYASVLALTEGSATTTFSGSNNWGHGQSLTGAGATVTKNTMPVGAAGTGSLVVMHRAVVEWDTSTPREAITAYYCFYAVPPVSAACDP